MDGTRSVAAALWTRDDWPAEHEMNDDAGIDARVGPVLESANRRQAERLPVKIKAKLRELGNLGNEARVLNLSETGFMAATDADFAVGARVWLMLPGRDRANAVVRWVEAGRIGAEFTEPFAVEGVGAKL